ncbi:MAG: hypothetical protein LBH44_04965 [Treponema sp.]|jgi:tetratricopeptide (TPR) repeat protein|nr:hypothetical protein [Treponema sp.]
MNCEVKKIRNLIIVFILLILSFPLSAQASPWWYSLEQGKFKYRSGDYGGALLSFEDARRQRHAMYEQMERDFINFLSINEVRRLGDSLERVERFSYDRYYTAASAAIEELYYRVPKESFNNSALAALAAIGKLKDYPEAEYWIGETYRVEGELSLALSQFRKAYARRDLFDNPGFAAELLYKTASILKTTQDYNEMERILLSIIADFDTLWADAGRVDVGRTETDPVPYALASASFAAQAMSRTLENEGIGRFLELYRYNNVAAEQAHRLLGFHYAVTGRPPAQQHLMFAFLIQNSIIIEEIRRSQYNFTFSNLAGLTEKIRKSSLLLSYIDEVEYYKTAYYLAASLYRSGKTAIARNIWTFLAEIPEAGEWNGRAIGQLRNPHLEPIVRMP